MTRARGRHGLRLTALAAVLLAGLLAVLPITSGADEPTVVGWWHRDVPLSDAEPQGGRVEGQSAGGAVPFGRPSQTTGVDQVPPPPVAPPLPVPTIPPDVTVPDPGGDVPTPSAAPEGGLLVANDVTGVRAIAALRFDAPDAGGALLSLRLAAGSTPSPAIKACPALSDWQPGPDQPWSARPAHDCARLSSSSSLSEDGSTMTWALPDTFRRAGGPYDVLLVPAGADGTPFEVAFDKPGADAFTVTSPLPDEAPPYEPPLPDYLPPPADSFSPDGYDFGPAYVPVPAGAVPTEPVGRRGPAAAPGPLGRLGDALENPTTRRVATALLVALGLVSYRQSNEADRRAPRLLGALAGPSGIGGADAVLRPSAARPGGLGRFARPRSAPPPRL